jgi:pyrroline-5-carboxylate reductase
MELALQTMIGTAAMLQETGMHPGEFKDRVSSPGGTTITGLHVLENGGLRGLLISAVEAAARKTREL